MSENAIDSVKATPEPAAAKPKRKPGKKAEVVAMMKRAKGVTLSRKHERQRLPHTVRGFVKHPGQQGGEKVKLPKNAAGNGSSCRCLGCRARWAGYSPILAMARCGDGGEAELSCFRAFKSVHEGSAR
jgi:hypothetical protein